MRYLPLAASVLGLSLVSVTAQQPGPYRLVGNITVGGEGGWDYLSVDAPAKRLYVSHGAKVVVIDVEKSAVVGEIADTPGVHGAVATVPGRVFTSNGRASNASVVDATTLKTIATVETGGNPDFVLYEPGRKEVYTFNGGGKSATVINATTAAVVATIPLGGKPEAGVADPAAGRVYVNIENTNVVAVIDTASHTVVHTWPIAPGEEATGLAIDATNHRLFVGAHNKMLLMLDSSDGRVLAQVPIGAGVDATWFDPGTRLVFASCGDGTTTIAREESPSVLRVVQTLATEAGARTMALDETTHRIYLAAATFESVPGAEAGRRRLTVVPDSMHVLVYGLEGK